MTTNHAAHAERAINSALHNPKLNDVGVIAVALSAVVHAILALQQSETVVAVEPEPLPENAYVWTKGDYEAELLARIVDGAHVTMESGGVTYSGPLNRDDAGWTRLGTKGFLLTSPTGPFSLVREADRITVVPPPEPVLPEWAAYWDEGRGRMIAATPDGQVWVMSCDGGWVLRQGGGDRITPADLIARGGRLLIDHTGHVVEEGR